MLVQTAADLLLQHVMETATLCRDRSVLTTHRVHSRTDGDCNVADGLAAAPATASNVLPLGSNRCGGRFHARCRGKSPGHSELIVPPWDLRFLCRASRHSGGEIRWNRDQ